MTSNDYQPPTIITANGLSTPASNDQDKQLQNQPSELYLVTDWTELVRNATNIPCFSKAMGWGGVLGVLAGSINKYYFSRSLFDGLMGGFLISSMVIWLKCRREYETMRDTTRNLIMAQSKPVKFQHMLDEERNEREQVSSRIAATNSDPSKTQLDANHIDRK